MINNFYKNFKVRDYLESNENIQLNNAVDCSLGTNPFIKSGYIDPSYSKLKSKLIEVIKEDIGVQLSMSNISFGSWHNGNYTKFMSVFNR